MTRNKQSDFETAAQIIKSLDLKYDNDYETNIQNLFDDWINIVGEKLAKYSSPKELTSDGILIVGCKNSVVANELFISRIKINEIIKKKAIKNNLGFFKYIKITYNR